MRPLLRTNGKFFCWYIQFAIGSMLWGKANPLWYRKIWQRTWAFVASMSPHKAMTVLVKNTLWDSHSCEGLPVKGKKMKAPSRSSSMGYFRTNTIYNTKFVLNLNQVFLQTYLYLIPASKPSCKTLTSLAKALISDCKLAPFGAYDSEGRMV